MNKMTPDEHKNAARQLLEAERKGNQIGLLTQRYPKMNMDDAYAIQKSIFKAKLAQGRKLVGWKIGLTSKAMQYALNIDVPDSGFLFDDMKLMNGATIAKGRFIQPRVEAEIAFVMKKSLKSKYITKEEVINATDYICASLEILDTRIVRKDKATGETRKIFDTISDNAANAGFVLSEKHHAPDAFDLRRVGVIVTRNGQVEETGLGAGVLNDPIQSVIWLVERMANYEQHIEPGQVILSGSFIRPIECTAGSKIFADFGDFGTVNISFD
jgi:2-oxo-hept-3-ene-1,7-dioate hydratase